MESMPFEKLSRDKSDSIGMTANGTSGRWDIEVDETLSGEEKWFLQFGGPTFYLYIQIDSPCVIQKLVSFVDSHYLPPKIIEPKSKDIELKIGHFSRTPVSLLWDDRCGGDRCYILIGGSGESQARFTLTGKDLSDFKQALRQVVDELDEEGLLSGPS